jgi:hypothetical protein
MNIMRSFSVFCSYKLEFYHERLSVSQKARIKWVYRGIEVEKRTGMGQGQIQEQIGIIVIPSIEGMQHTSMSYRYGININQQFFSSSYISTYGAREVLL